VATCAGCGGVARALHALAARATPRGLLLLMLVGLAAWMAWHWAIMGEGGALEWGTASSELEGAGAAPIDGAPAATFASPPPPP
jgi:hypothetical protein